MATRRRLLQFQSVLAQQALRGAIPKPRPSPPNPHRRLLHSPSPSPSSHLLWLRSVSLLPMSAAAVAAAARTVAARWLAARGAGSLELFSLQRRRSSGSLFSKFLRVAPWAHWIPSADGVVLMLIGANVAVFMLWRLADPRFMRKHFMISLDNFKSGRLHTLLTSHKCLSHAEADHLFTNMIGLYFFGTSVYVGCDNSRTPALGASAAVNAVILLEIFLYPKRLVYLYFFIPIPAAIMGAALISADLWRVKKGQGGVSGSAHLGGALVAALMWARIRKAWI